MRMLGLGGMTSLKAPRAATLNPAQVLGLSCDLGSLEVGQQADLVVIDGDVLVDIRQSDRIAHAMPNGRLFALLGMIEVGPGARSKARKPFFFGGAAANTAVDEGLLTEALGYAHAYVH